MNALLPVLILKDLFVGEADFGKQLQIAGILWNLAPAGTATCVNQSRLLLFAGHLGVTEPLIYVSQFHIEEANRCR